MKAFPLTVAAALFFGPALALAVTTTPINRGAPADANRQASTRQTTTVPSATSKTLVAPVVRVTTTSSTASRANTEQGAAAKAQRTPKVESSSSLGPVVVVPSASSVEKAVGQAHMTDGNFPQAYMLKVVSNGIPTNIWVETRPGSRPQVHVYTENGGLLATAQGKPGHLTWDWSPRSRLDPTVNITAAAAKRGPSPVPTSVTVQKGAKSDSKSK